MKKPKILFHGSRFEIGDFLEPRKAEDTSKKDNCQTGVYATDRFECAITMSLSGESPAFMNYSENNAKIIFMHKQPNPEKTAYVYEISSETFEETSEKHQWVSGTRVKILKTYTFKAKELEDYWRFATEEEFNLKWRKFGYPAPYKEFFENHLR